MSSSPKVYFLKPKLPAEKNHHHILERRYDAKFPFIKTCRELILVIVVSCATWRLITQLTFWLSNSTSVLANNLGIIGKLIISSAGWTMVILLAAACYSLASPHSFSWRFGTSKPLPPVISKKMLKKLFNERVDQSDYSSISPAVPQTKLNKFESINRPITLAVNDIKVDDSLNDYSGIVPGKISSIETQAIDASQTQQKDLSDPSNIRSSCIPISTPNTSKSISKVASLFGFEPMTAPNSSKVVPLDKKSFIINQFMLGWVSLICLLLVLRFFASSWIYSLLQGIKTQDSADHPMGSFWATFLALQTKLFLYNETIGFSLLFVFTPIIFRIYGVLKRPYTLTAQGWTGVGMSSIITSVAFISSILHWSWSPVLLFLCQISTEVSYVFLIVRNSKGGTRRLRNHLDLVNYFYSAFWMFTGLEQSAGVALIQLLGDGLQSSASLQVFVTLSMRSLMGLCIIMCDLSVNIIYGRRDLFLTFGHRLIESFTITSIALDNISSENALALHGFSNLFIVLLRDSGIMEDILFAFNHRLQLSDLYQLPDSSSPFLKCKQSSNFSPYHSSRLMDYFNSFALPSWIRNLIHATQQIDIDANRECIESVNNLGGSIHLIRTGLKKSSPIFTLTETETPSIKKSSDNADTNTPQFSPLQNHLENETFEQVPKFFSSMNSSESTSPGRYLSGPQLSSDMECRYNEHQDYKCSFSRQISVSSERVSISNSYVADPNISLISALPRSNSSLTALSDIHRHRIKVKLKLNSSTFPILRDWHQALKLQVERMQISALIRISTIGAFMTCELLSQLISSFADNNIPWGLVSPFEWIQSQYRFRLLGFMCMTSATAMTLVYLVLYSKVEAINKLIQLSLGMNAKDNSLKLKVAKANDKKSLALGLPVISNVLSMPRNSSVHVQANGSDSSRLSISYPLKSAKADQTTSKVKRHLPYIYFWRLDYKKTISPHLLMTVIAFAGYHRFSQVHFLNE